jgi:pimeloyl-ACP methyl ester carboxylesterase
VRLLSYSPETVAVLPLLIHTAYTRSDWGPLAAQALLATSSLAQSLSAGLGSAVLCSEDEPFFTNAQAAEANAGAYLGNTQTDDLRALCAEWPRGSVPAGFKAPVASSVPTLLLSGEADPVTPPENADQAAATLPNSRHLVAPGQGHNVVGRGCLPRLVADFYGAGSAAGLSAGCLARIAPLPFFVSFAGPRP